MTIKLICIGKTDDKSLELLIMHYIKRISFYTRFEIEIIPDLKKGKNLSETEQKQKEGDMISSKISTSDVLVLLDENGQQFSSENFADYLQKHMNSGIKNLLFVIGGPYGFSDEIYQRANGKVSLSKMTFSHQMIRLFFIEQLYRAHTIFKNEPYHHR